MTAPRLHSTVASLTSKIVGTDSAEVSGKQERNGYIFWGAIALFVAVPEVIAARSSHFKHAIPWPTMSNLIGADLERRHHWVALVVVGAIALIVWHTVTYPAQNKKLGQPVGSGAAAMRVVGWKWGPAYLLLTAAVTSLAGFLAAGAGGDKNRVGYAIYLTLFSMGVVVPSAFARFRGKLLSIPTLFATIALLHARPRMRWVAGVVVALLVILCFHLALYPWPNYPFGGP